MTRDEIMKMEDRELFENIREVFGWGSLPELDLVDTKYQLLMCYDAEEKIKEMGASTWVRWGIILRRIVLNHGGHTEDIYHAHPRPRAQAILLTLNDKEAPND